MTLDYHSMRQGFKTSKLSSLFSRKSYETSEHYAFNTFTVFLHKNIYRNKNSKSFTLICNIYRRVSNFRKDRFYDKWINRRVIMKSFGQSLL